MVGPLVLGVSRLDQRMTTAVALTGQDLFVGQRKAAVLIVPPGTAAVEVGSTYSVGSTEIEFCSEPRRTLDAAALKGTSFAATFTARQAL